MKTIRDMRYRYYLQELQHGIVWHYVNVRDRVQAVHSRGYATRLTLQQALMWWIRLKLFGHRRWRRNRIRIVKKIDYNLQ